MVATKKSVLMMTESELLLDFGGSFVIKFSFEVLFFYYRLVFSFDFGDGYT